MNTALVSSNGNTSAEHGFAPASDRRPFSGSESPLCLEWIADRCNDDGMTCGMILHKFATRSLDQVAALERAFDAGNARELARQAHTVKSLAADLAAEVLCDRAEALEQMAERGDLEQAGRALVRTREEIERCVEAASELLGRLLDTEANGTAR